MKDVKKVLTRYKQRFISPRSISRTYFLTRLNANHSIDLVNFDDKFGDNSNLYNQTLNYEKLSFKKLTVDTELVKDLLYDGKTSQEKVKEIFPDFTKKDFGTISTIKKEIQSLKLELDKMENSEELDESEIVKTQHRINAEEKVLNSTISNFTEKNIKRLNKEFLAIGKIEKISESMMKDFGKDDLYLGFPFIEGRFQSGKLFRAPLILHRVEVSQTQNAVKLKIAEGESIINPVFLVSYHLENELEHKLLKWDIESQDFLNEALKTLSNLGIKVSQSNQKAQQFKSYTKKEYREEVQMDFNSFKIKTNFVLGLFPISDKNIFNDLQELEDSTFSEEDSISTFINGNENLDNLFVKKEKKRVKENEIKYITQLDYSKKSVLKKSLEKNLVIEGPPGTGKSQVISNIVANYVDKGKKVLVVSEKLAALEVIYNRIGNLSNNALLIRNHIRDKKSFYEQIKKAINAIIVEGTYDTYKPFKELDQESEKVFEKLETRDEIYRSDYSGFTFEEIVKYSREDIIEIRKLAQVVDELYIHDIPIKENLSQICQLADSVFGTSLYNDVSEVYDIISEYTELDFMDTSEYAKYIIEKEVVNHDKYELLFYCIMNGYEINDSHISKDSSYIHLGENKSFKTALEDVENFINTGNVEEYIRHLKELSKDAYKNVDVNKDFVNLLNNWNVLSVKKRVLAIKKITDKNFKFSFFSSFSPKKLLIEEEAALYNEIEENIENLEPKQIMVNGLTDKVKAILNYIINHQEENTKDIAIGIFMSGIYDLDLGLHASAYSKIKDLSCSMNYAALKTISLADKSELNIALASVKDGISTKEGVIDAISKYSVKDEYRKIKDEIDFYKKYDDVYNETLKTIDIKMLKSRITIENNLKRQISLMGQTNNDFAKAIAELKRISLLKRKKSIAVTTKKFTKEILELFPICLMTPGSVSATLENSKDLFDVVIFDEASQMFVERAVPAIHRSKRIIVAGDSKQLRPSSFFTQRFTEGDELDDDEELGYDVTAALEEESLLDYCKYKYESVYLKYHYRSDHKELIEFSNRAFYENKLTFSSNIRNHEKKPIEVIDVAGEWVDNTNDIEAQRIVELIKEILKNRVNNETIGIITFNAKQMELIDEMLDDESFENEDLAKELKRIDESTGADESLFVKNIENVQGDERDIIIFSIAYAKNQKGRFINSFGPITQPTGENRLNVAVTRARKKIYIVKSIPSSIMNVREENRGNYFFKKYLQYVEKLNSGEDMEEFLNQLSDIEETSEVLSGFDSPFEEEVFAELQKELDDRYELRNQIKVGSFSIDLAIYDKKEDMFVLGIECDGAMYHSSKDAVEYDFYRQDYLESRGWTIHRIWSTNWWTNKALEIQKIKASFKSITETKEEQ